MFIFRNKDKDFFTLGGKLLVYILLASSAVTTLLTAGVFYFDYVEEKQNLDSIQDNIRNNAAMGLSSAVYELNDNAIKSQVDGLKNVADIISIKITDEEKESIYSFQKRELNSEDETIHVELKSPDDSVTTAGWMEATITYENMKNRLIKRVIVFFGTQFLKTSALSAIILLIIYNLFTRHLKKITNYLETRDYAKETQPQLISLDRKAGKKDELDILVQKLNELDLKIVNFNRLAIEENKALEAEKSVAEAKALHAAKLASLGEVSAGIAHEINNPLAIIKGYNHSIFGEAKKAENDTKKIMKFAVRVDNMVKRITKITRGMLVFAREDVQELPPVNVTVKDFFADVSYLYNQRLKNNNVKLEAPEEFPSDWVIKCKIVPLGQVVYNLVSNALDAISEHENPWIKINVEEKGDELEFSVTDCGDGITKETEEKIFQPFFTTKEVGKGTGLGLAISQGTLEEMGSSLKIDHDCENTRFYFRVKKEKKLAKTA